jgi:HTH-type transcriptional regulator / antitoxin HigA
LELKTTTDEITDQKPAEVFPPGEFIRDELEERGWTQADLAKIMGRPLPAVNEIILGKRSITPETAIALGSAFGTSAELWLNLESAFQLSKIDVEDHGAIRERAKLFESAPVKDLERRGWIKVTRKIIDLQHELSRFFDLPEIEKLRAAAKSSIQSSELTPEQIAWCVRALRLARSVPARKFTRNSLESGVPKLRALADFPENVRHVPKCLSEMGIRLVVVEHLPKSKIDGAALWLGDDWEKPVVALSLRYDRIDSFWHTLFHELSHIKHRDSYVIDVDLVGADRCLSNEAVSEIERRANEEAADMLIPKEKLRSFILRTRPFYYTDRINQFANLLKIHPGIIAGQLQFKNEIKWAANRAMLVKVRNILVSSALTDGWGITIAKAK